MKEMSKKLKFVKKVMDSSYGMFLSVLENNIAERIYRCEACGLAIDRNYNAAINIREEGLR
jgi:transposase